MTLENACKIQAKALIATLDILANESYLDSDGRNLRAELDAWIKHITPMAKWEEN